MEGWRAAQVLGCLIAELAAPAYVASGFVTSGFSRTFPRQAMFVRVAFLAWAGLAIACWWRYPTALSWLLLVPVAGWLLLLARELRGRCDSRGTPAGSLSILAGIRALGDREYYLRKFARYGPIFTMSQYGNPTICVLGLERIEKLIKGHAEFLGPSSLPISNSVEGTFLRYMPAETHALYGRLFRRAMSGPFTDEQVAEVERICAGELQALTGNEVSPFGPLEAIARRSLNLLLLGLNEEEPAGRRFDELARGFARAGIGWSLGQRDRRSLEEMRGILARKVELDATLADRESGGAAGVSVMVRLRRQDPSMPDRVCLDNLIVMHRIATGNVSSLLAWLLVRWATESSIVAEIRAESPEARESLLRLFLAETLRTSQSEYLYRRVGREFRFEGHRFPRGWLVRGCIWESHRTSSVIEEPGQFRLRREPAPYDRRHFIPLGMGAHACNGGDVNELICLSFLKRLLNASTVRVVHAEPWQRQMRHWSHWQPNQAMRARCEGLA